MDNEALAAVYDLDGAFNDVALTLMRGASEQDVIDRLDIILERYGGVGAYGRENQTSHQFISEEIKQLRGTGMVAPIIFLGVAAFLLNVTISRLVQTQREQIAALKAFGYSRLEIGWHYLKLVLAISFTGLGIGVLLGAWLGWGLTRMYTLFYHFPLFLFRMDPIVGIQADRCDCRGGGYRNVPRCGPGRIAPTGRGDATRTARGLPAHRG